MIKMEPQFVSPEDFLNYWGVDLNSKLKSNSNDSNKANIFLKRVEDRLMSWIDANTFRIISWDILRGDYNKYRDDKEREIAEKQKDAWRLAILTQAMYIFKNSEIGLDSGYDPEKGIVAKKDDLSAIEICQSAIDYIKVAGLYNHVVTNRIRHTTFFGG